MLYDWYAPSRAPSMRDAFDGGHWIAWDRKRYSNHDRWESPSGMNVLFADGHVNWVGDGETVLYKSGRFHWGPAKGATVWDSNSVKVNGVQYSYRHNGALFRRYADLGGG